MQADEKERPLECIGCKKSQTVHYITIREGKSSHIYMCQDCPHLHHLLGHKKTLPLQTYEEEVKCDFCGTTEQECIQTLSLGCCSCYSIFSQHILQQLQQQQKIYSPKNILSTNILYYGREPACQSKNPAAIGWTQLQQNLTQALIDEEYEKAAWLRDKIKLLENMKHSHHE